MNRVNSRTDADHHVLPVTEYLLSSLAFHFSKINFTKVICNFSAKIYDKLLVPLERRFLSDWRIETLSYLPENSVVLEIGTGTGNNFRHYPEYPESICTDISIEMLEIAKTKAADKRNIKLLQANAEILPFGDNSFDAAFATLVFCSIDSPERAFAELIRVLKANDRIVLLEHVRPDGLLGYIFDVLSLFTVALFGDHFNRKTSEIAEASGLRIIEIKKKGLGIVNLIVCEVVK